MMKVTIIALFSILLGSAAEAAQDYMFYMVSSDVVKVGDYAYTPVTWRVVKDRKGNVKWADDAYLSVFDLTSGKLATKLTLAGNPQSLVQCRGYLVCATGRELIAISIAEPAAPAIVSRTTVSEDPLHAAEKIKAVGDFLFCACRKSGLVVYRLGRKGELSRAAAFRGPHWGTSRGVALDGNRIAVADNIGLALLTYSRKRKRVQIAEESYLVLPHSSRAVDLEGDLAVVGASMFELQVIDVRDLKKPKLTGTYKRHTNYYGVSFFDVVFKDRQAHIPMGEYAYLIVDVSDAAAPRLVLEYKPLREPDKPGWTRYSMSRHYQGVLVDSAAKRTYLASGRDLDIVDIQDLRNPRHIAWIRP